MAQGEVGLGSVMRNGVGLCVVLANYTISWPSLLEQCSTY